MLRRQLVTGTAAAGASLAVSGTLAATRMATDTEGAATIVERFAATLAAHDIMAFAALFADGYVNHQVSAAAPSSPGQSTPGTSAKRATVDLFAARLTGLPDLRVEVEAAVASGGRAAASFLYTGTHEGPYLGIAPTGRRLRFTSCDIFRVRDGLIVEHWGMGDIAGILAQLRG